ncbi:MAG: hypothetical protein VZR00_05750 [Lachnospiraceae bacterium]|jgi:hypothetical protein|nr:hypothetical protein [Lachnospiraceae bacterium]MEE3461382.1 hypothetical protein [Lachnospiraceae bacterium]
MREKVMTAVLSMALVLSMTGCAGVTSLTKSQNDEAAEYMAGELLKHNRDNSEVLDYDRQNATVSSISAEESTESPDAVNNDSSESSENDAQDNSSSDGNNTDSSSESSDPSTDNGDNGTDASADNEENTADLRHYSDVSDVYGVDGLSVSFGGYKLTDSYKSGRADIEPDQGNKLLVAQVALKNDTAVPVKLNMLSKEIEYTISSGNGQEQGISAMFTVIPNDVQVFNGSIAGKKTKNCILVFQVSDDFSMEGAVINVKGSDGYADINVK